MTELTIVRTFYGIRWFVATLAAIIFLRWESLYGALFSYLLTVFCFHWILMRLILSPESREDTKGEDLETFLSYLQWGRGFLFLILIVFYAVLRNCSHRAWIVCGIYGLSLLGLRAYRYFRQIPIPTSWPQWPRKYLSTLCQWIQEAADSPY